MERRQRRRVAQRKPRRRAQRSAPRRMEEEVDITAAVDMGPVLQMAEVVDMDLESVEKPDSSAVLGNPVAGASVAVVLYETPNKALVAVREDYHYWSGKLTETSLQFSYAVIAANWAVFGSVDGILKNRWSKLSVALVVVGLGLGMAGAKWLSELHRKRIDYAAHAERWADEFRKNTGTQSAWPFTNRIERLGRIFRWAKTWLPLAAGLLFLVALLSR